MEVENSGLVTEAGRVVRCDAHFLRELIEAGHIVLGVGGEGHAAGSADAVF